jgi:hypothetical protein
MSLIKNMQIIYHEKVQESTKSGTLYPWQVACKILINNTLQLCKIKNTEIQDRRNQSFRRPYKL